MIGSIARRYARALLALARDDGRLEETAGELGELAEIAGEPDIGAALANPLLSASTRQSLAKTIAEKLNLSATTKNFVCLLADQRRLDQIVGIAEQYRRLLDRELGRVRAGVDSAVELDAEQVRALVDKLERLTGKSVVVERRVDPALLGGVVVQMEGTVYDGSVRTQLERLATVIAGNRSGL